MNATRSDVRRADVLLALLIATDALFILGHIALKVLHLVIWDTPGLFDSNPSPYSIVTEGGYAETFQYLKAYWLAVMFLWLVVETRQFGFLAWSVTFVYFGLDDLLEIHEEYGNDIAVRYNFPELLGQRPRDLGELAIFAIVGAALIVFHAIAYFTGSDRFRQTSRKLFALIALLGLFGIVVDALHIVFLETRAGAFVGLIEDGGELIVLSIAVWFVWQLVGRPYVTDGEVSSVSLRRLIPMGRDTRVTIPPRE